MDSGWRQRLDLLNAQSNALAGALCGLSDTNESVRQRCIVFATEVKGLVKAWSNLSKALQDPQLEARPAFSQIIDRVLGDNSRIINDLRSQLAEVRTKQAHVDAAIRGKRWVVPRNKSAHLLSNFLARDIIHLRQHQISYAVSVLDVLLGVAFYAKILGETTSRSEEQASLQDQLARCRVESDARTSVFKEERRIGDKYVVSSLWLSSVTWHSDSFDVPPFETLALQWFTIASADIVHTAPSTGEAQNLTRLVMQLQQDLREQHQQHKQQVDEHKRQHEALRTWAEGTIGQLEFSQQKSTKEAASKLEEMRNQLETDKVVIDQLKHSRNEWSIHYRKQSASLQQLEAQIKEVREENALLKRSSLDQKQSLNELVEKYNRLHMSHKSLQQQNQVLRQQLTEAEEGKQNIEARHSQLQARYSKALQHNKRWKELYDSGPGEREAQLRQLEDDVHDFKKEIADLKAELSYVTGDRNQLRDSLKKAEGARTTEKLHSTRLQERLAIRGECPSSYENRASRRRSRSRQRSENGSRGASRSTSKDTMSRTSSSTFVDDSNSDHEYYMEALPRRTSTERTSKIGEWFSPRRMLVVSNR